MHLESGSQATASILVNNNSRKAVTSIPLAAMRDGPFVISRDPDPKPMKTLGKPRSFLIKDIIGDTELEKFDSECDAGGQDAISITSREEDTSLPDLDWLRCSRYNPPKIPRTRRKKEDSSYVARKPRVPFTSYQQSRLELYYRTRHYLNPREVRMMEQTLGIPAYRIKIWFQNRRARERKELRLSQPATARNS